MVNIKDINPKAEYVVFDDFEWQFFPNKKSWWGGQNQFTITGKYHPMFTIKNWNKPCIYICNPEYDPYDHLDNWFKESCYHIVLLNKFIK